MGLGVSILFAVFAMFCWGIGDFLIQKSTRKIGDIESIAFIGIIGSVGLLPFIIKDFYLLFSVQSLFLIILLSVIIFITTLLDCEALRQGKLSIVDVIIEIELPVTIVFGFIFLKETLSVLQFFIIFLVFMGIILIATKSFKHWKTRLEKGALLAFIAAVGMGISNFLVAKSSRQVSPLLVIWAVWTLTIVFSLLFIRKRKGHLKFIKDGIKFKWLILAMGVFDTLAWLFYAFAVLKSEISIITAITESYPAIALFLGFWINKEKINWHQWLGAGIALLASFLLAFFA